MAHLDFILRVYPIEPLVVFILMFKLLFLIFKDIATNFTTDILNVE
jgi:hypothetical protein